LNLIGTVGSTRSPGNSRDGGGKGCARQQRPRLVIERAPFSFQPLLK
jgi:hypothetical protein